MCVLPHTSHRMLLHTGGTCVVPVWYTGEVCQVNAWIRGCRRCFGFPDSNNKPKSQTVELLFGLWRTVHVFMYIWVWASKILSVRFIFPQGRISLTNVSERKDKMRLGMTLTSNPKDNSFVVRISLKFTQFIFFRYNMLSLLQRKRIPQDWQLKILQLCSRCALTA